LVLSASLRRFLEHAPVVGATFELDASEDASEMGAAFQWMDASQMMAEATEVYPGVAVVKHGYLPVGMCLEGSGDPYFVRLQDCALVRVLHDADWLQGLQEEAIETVLPSVFGIGM